MWFNPIMKWLIRSPLHGFVNKNMMVIGYTGRRSSKRCETSVNYVCNGDDLLVTSYLSRTRKGDRPDQFDDMMHARHRNESPR